MKYGLDTNILVAILNGQEKAVENLESLAIEHEAVLSVIVFGELCYGALSSARAAENLAKIGSPRGLVEARRRPLVPAPAELPAIAA